MTKSEIAKAQTILGDRAERFETAIYNDGQCLTVYAYQYANGTERIELVQHYDGRVGLWSVHRQQWVEAWGLGTNQAGFVNAILDWPGVLTDDGEAWLAARKSASGV